MSRVLQPAHSEGGSHGRCSVAYPHPSNYPPYSDGSMTIDTDYFQPTIISQSPYHLGQSLPNPPLEQYLHSPHAVSALPFSPSPPTNSLHPAALFSNFKFEDDQPGPSLSFSPPYPAAVQESPKNASSGKAPTTAKSKLTRKMSMHDAAHMSNHMKASNYGRPATMHGHGHTRAASQDDVFGPNAMPGGPSGDRYSSISPPGYSLTPHYAGGIPRGDSWNGNGTAGMLGGSYNASLEHAIMDR